MPSLARNWTFSSFFVPVTELYIHRVKTFATCRRDVRGLHNFLTFWSRHHILHRFKHLSVVNIFPSLRMKPSLSDILQSVYISDYVVEFFIDLSMFVCPSVVNIFLSLRMKLLPSDLAEKLEGFVGELVLKSVGGHAYRYTPGRLRTLLLSKRHNKLSFWSLFINYKISASNSRKILAVLAGWHWKWAKLTKKHGHRALQSENTAVPKTKKKGLYTKRTTNIPIFAWEWKMRSLLIVVSYLFEMLASKLSSV